MGKKEVPSSVATPRPILCFLHMSYLSQHFLKIDIKTCYEPVLFNSCTILLFHTCQLCIVWKKWQGGLGLPPGPTQMPSLSFLAPGEIHFCFSVVVAKNCTPCKLAWDWGPMSACLVVLRLSQLHPIFCVLRQLCLLGLCVQCTCTQQAALEVKWLAKGNSRVYFAKLVFLRRSAARSCQNYKPLQMPFFCLCR